jgi:hypothetical protein
MDAQTTPITEPIVGPLRRLGTAWRSLYLAQMVVFAAMLGALLVDLRLPGILAALLRGPTAVNVFLGVCTGLLWANDLAAALVERALARRLGAERTWLRKTLGVAYLLPGWMLLRRVLVLVFHALWFGVVACFLLLWFLEVVILAVPARIIPGVSEGFGVASDAMDQVLSTVASWLKRGLDAVSLCPTRSVERSELELLRLLVRSAAKRQPPEPPSPADQNVDTAPTGSEVTTASSCQ